MSIKAGARHSAADTQHIQAAHDALVKAGAMCAGSPEDMPTKAVQIPADAHPGAMIALMLSPEQQSALRDASGIADAEADHVTLAYLGPDASALLSAKNGIIQGLASVAGETPPLDGECGGVARFAASESSDGQDVIVALYDSADLPDLYADVIECLEYCGVAPASDHGFTPHITLAYIVPDAASPIDTLPRVSLPVASLSLIWAGERIDFPLMGVEGMDMGDAEMMLRDALGMRGKAGSIVDKIIAAGGNRGDEIQVWRNDKTGKYAVSVGDWASKETINAIRKVLPDAEVDAEWRPGTGYTPVKAASDSPGDYLVVGDPKESTTWHLQVRRNGTLDHRLMGGAWAALTSPNGFRGNRYEGPGKEEAIAKLRKLYKQEGMALPGETKSTDTVYAPIASIKAIGDYMLRIKGIVRGGKDLADETFMPDTDLGFDRSPIGMPVYYDHAKRHIKSQVGKVTAWEDMGDSIDFIVELDRAKRYADTIMQLNSAKALGGSTGALGHLVIAEDGMLKRWIVGELSLTPTPAEPRTRPDLRDTKSADAPETNTETGRSPVAVRSVLPALVTIYTTFNEHDIQGRLDRLRRQ